MREFKGKTVIITGAGSGFGLEFAKEAARRGMRLVLADINLESAERTLKICEELGAEAITLRTDVSLESEVDEMVISAVNAFDSIDLLFNNAGIGLVGRVWEIPTQDWKWAIDINLMSQIYAMRAAIPIMLKQDTPCHIVNVSSIAGLVVTGNMGPYAATKHAAVALSEATQFDLERIGARIHLSVFCPDFVKTNLHRYEKSRPERYKSNDPYYKSVAYYLTQKEMEMRVTRGKPIQAVGPLVFTAIEEEQFYIVTNPVFDKMIEGRVQDLLNGKNPDASRLLF
jgi:NAD(P)-dependent dehydrogenase (short-subunit alcohol dehydrogenase family)